MKCFCFFVFTLLVLSADAQVSGIGARLKIDTISGGSTIPRIVEVFPNSPASDCCVPEGCYIIEVDGVSCGNMVLEELVVRIRGAIGTKLKLLLADNPYGKNAVKYNLTRAPISAMQQKPYDTRAAFYDNFRRVVDIERGQGHTMVLEAELPCGDSVFKVPFDNALYITRCFLLEGKSDEKKKYDITVLMYADINEEDPYALSRTSSTTVGNNVFSEVSGGRLLEGTGEVIIEVKTNGDLGKCMGLGVMVYKY